MRAGTWWTGWTHLDSRYGGQTYILHGQDLGASAALWSAGEERVAFLVAESPVIELYDAVRYLLREQFGIPGLLMPVIDWNARKVLPDGRSMGEFSAVEATQGAQTPVLLLAAGADTIVDTQTVAQFAETYAGPVEYLEAARGGPRHGLSPVPGGGGGSDRPLYRSILQSISGAPILSGVSFLRLRPSLLPRVDPRFRSTGA